MIRHAQTAVESIFWVVGDAGVVYSYCTATSSSTCETKVGRSLHSTVSSVPLQAASRCQKELVQLLSSKRNDYPEVGMRPTSGHTHDIRTSGE